MLYRLMAYLFHDDDFYRYTPKPWHILYPVIMLALGTFSFAYEWFAFGGFVFLIGLGLGIAIVLGILWDKSIEYWSEIRYVLEAAAKIKDPVMRADMLKSMGYNATPETVTIEETKQADSESGYSKVIHRIPVSSSVLQVIADKVLMSGNADFVEEAYKDVPNFDKVRKIFKEKGWVAQKNNANVRLGYAFNKKGIEALYEYASEGVKIDLKRKGEKNDTKED